MTVLKADGLLLKPAPKNLYTARFNNAAIQILRRLNDYHVQVTASLFRDAEMCVGWERVMTY
ncbi:MAG: hypothetical protein KME41_17830 [Candidatus Thiodiazotropha sp. (ex Lucina pensylvanica)]|nr:hypothetical protein [Candidatus Thiodiazotropha sp. (ex Lucina pensylvanica)]